MIIRAADPFLYLPIRPVWRLLATQAHVGTEINASAASPGPLRTSSSADLELMRRAGSGDREAQRILVTRLMGRANRLAQALLRNREDALDASQVALLGILRSTANFRGESSVECWADRIVVRTSLRMARLKRRNEANDSGDCSRLSIPPGSEARICANQYLSRLPEAQRTALLLRSGFGYTVEEISDLTGSPVNTVKDRLKRARTAVHRELGRERRIAAPLSYQSR